MTGDSEVVKKRFDDAYRSLLTVAGIFAFAFSNYAQGVSTNFIYKIGIPFVLTAVVVWSISHINNKKWEYQAKFAGFILVWFATFGLLSIIYMKDVAGTLLGPGGWLIVDSIVTLGLIPVVGRSFVNTGIMTRRYTIFMMAFAIFIGLASALLTSI